MRQSPPFPVEPPISTFRVRILGGRCAPTNGKEIWREIEVAANQPLSDLGEAIPLAFAFETACPWSFVLHGPVAGSTVEYRFAARGGLRVVAADGYAYDPARVLLRDLPLPGATGHREFFFRFDDGSWLFGVKLVKVFPMAEPHRRYPHVAACHGDLPALAATPAGLTTPPAVPPPSMGELGA